MTDKYTQIISTQADAARQLTRSSARKLRRAVRNHAPTVARPAAKLGRSMSVVAEPPEPVPTQAQKTSPEPLAESASAASPKVADTVQNARLELELPDGSTSWLRIERTLMIGDELVISGWKTSATRLLVSVGGHDLAMKLLPRKRPDVAAALGLKNPHDLGFLLHAPMCQSGQIAIRWDQDGAEQINLELDEGGAERLGAAEKFALAETEPPFSTFWSALLAQVTPLPAEGGSSLAYIDRAAVHSSSRQAMIAGWTLVDNDLHPSWFEDEQGQMTPLIDAMRRPRDDVANTYGQERVRRLGGPGFAALVTGLEHGDTVSLRVWEDGRVRLLSQAALAELPEKPKDMAEVLFAYSPSHAAGLHEFITTVAQPILGEAIEKQSRAAAQNPLLVNRIGKPPSNPKVSVIIPLYGRIDFIEHQLLEFARDPWLKKHAELIYVIDDPKIVEQATQSCATLATTYHLGLTTVWGGQQPGFLRGQQCGGPGGHRQPVALPQQRRLPPIARLVGDPS